MAEGRMNLAALQQRDPYITDIVDTASQVALYLFNTKTNEWEKTLIEGSLFLYKRSASPDNGFMILNRLGLNNLIEPITKDLEFQLQDPFLLYRNAKVIHGIWFYDKDECARIGQLMNSLLQLAIQHFQENRQRRASESDSSTLDKAEMESTGVRNVDILQMLSKAQDEYDKATTLLYYLVCDETMNGVKKTTKEGQRFKAKSGVPPKPFIDNPNASAMKSSEIHRPKPLKAGNDEEDTLDQDNNQNASSASAAPISLETLFRNASLQQQKQQGDKKDVAKAPGFHRSVSMSEGESKLQREESSNELPALLRHLMSTGSTVEEIEKQQRGEILSRNQQTRSPNSSSGRAASKFFLPSEEEKSTTGQKFYRQHSLQPMSHMDKSPQLLSDVTSDKSKMVKASNVSMETIQANILSRGESQNVQDLLHSKTKSPTFPVAQQQTNRRTSQSSLSSAKSGSDLLTPAALELSQSSFTSDLPERPASCSKILGSEVLLTPMAFIQGSQSPTLKGPVEVNSKPAHVEEKLPVAALTKDQLQQAMIYLIKNDPNFIDSLHEAYLNSLKDLANLKS